MAASKQFEPKQYELIREIALPRDRVWHLLSHTDHLNRAIGLSAVRYEEPVSLMRGASSRVAGQALRWREFPFEWIREKEFAVLRVYESGPIARFEGGVELEDGAAPTVNTPGTTRLRLWVNMQPAKATSAFLIPILARSFLDKTWNYCRDAVNQWETGDIQLAGQANRKNIMPALPRPVVSSPANGSQLHRLLDNLQNELQQNPDTELMRSAPELVRLLGEFLRTRGDSEVAQIRPYQLAGQWKQDREAVLGLCLQATRVGLLNLSWNMMCPNCRVSKAETRSLAQVAEQVHCDLCGVSYDLNFDRYIELKFAVHPAVRVASADIFCIGGPFLSPHVRVQRRIASGESSILTVPSSASLDTSPESSTDGLRLRVIGKNHTCAVKSSSDPAAVHKNWDEPLVYNDDGWERSEVLQAGEKLEIKNQGEQDIWVALEETQWDANATTAAHVTAMAEFRRWFSSEVLAPGRQIAIESLTLFFSDLHESTRLYERAGDAPAYGIVQRHFDFLSQKIEEQGGAVVKTIGDATMAVFQTPSDATRAALEIQKAIFVVNADLPADERIHLRVGLHHGPAIAVNSNDRLDYFGRIVNIAARLNEAGHGGDIVLSAECYGDLDVKEVLQGYPVEIENGHVRLKGIRGETEIYRVKLSS